MDIYAATIRLIVAYVTEADNPIQKEEGQSKINM